jgi:hypothetical protein
VNCVHPWDVFRGASTYSEIYAVKKDARQKQTFLDAVAKSRNAPSKFLILTLAGQISVKFNICDFDLCLSIKTKFG